MPDNRQLICISISVFLFSFRFVSFCCNIPNCCYSQLHLAIINEIPHIIWAIIRLAPAPWLLDLKNDDAQAPIHLAALTRQSNVVRRLVISGAKVGFHCIFTYLWAVTLYLLPQIIETMKKKTQTNKSECNV